MADSDIDQIADAYDPDLAVRQARDVAAFTRELIDGLTETRHAAFTHGIIDGLGCATCGGTGTVREPDPTDSAWFPKPPRLRPCRDCGGTGRDPAQEPT